MRKILLFPLLFLPLMLQGQEARKVKCRFLSFGGNSNVTSVVATSPDSAGINCPLSADQISDMVICPTKEDTIHFISSDDQATIANVKIAPSIKAALLVFVASPSKPDAVPAKQPWRVIVIEDSDKNFPDGGVFIANFYQKDIRFIVGEHKGMLHSAGMHGYAMPEKRDTFNMAPVIVDFAKDKKWQNANESALRFLPGMRYLIFAFTDPLSGRPRIRTYQDMAKPSAPDNTP
jgi:hypothetical protein